MARLERYLRTNGAAIPRTTLRYAIERFPEAKRRALLAATRVDRTTPIDAAGDNEAGAHGAEATCTARFKGTTAAGKARLETEVLHFRGGDLKLVDPVQARCRRSPRATAR